MPCLAAGDAIGLEQAHLRPAQAEGITDDVVDLLDARDVVVHEPERLAPERLEQPVADEGLDLAADHDGLHAERRHRAPPPALTTSGEVALPATISTSGSR